MLVLTRKETQSIIVGEGQDKIVITLLEIQNGSQARIGIQAPEHVSIVRSELLRERPGTLRPLKGA